MSIRGLLGRQQGSPRHVTRAILLAIMVGVTVMSIIAIEKSNRVHKGPLRGADFLYFYTLGHVASAGHISALYDTAALHEAQVALVPESTNFLYPAVYPPQTAVLFVPVAGLSYGTALLAWSLLTIVGYALIVWSAWRPVADTLPSRSMLIAAAAVFPPFWMLVLYGQISILILATFWAGWMALERRRHFLAGVAFGLLAIKPQFGLPLAVVVLARREWPMLGGAVASVAAQAAVCWLVLGTGAFHGFASTVALTLNNVDLLEATPVYSQSLRTLTRLMPNAIGIPLWIGAAAIVLWYTARVWRSNAPVRVRLGTVILASVLVNPHVIIYDAAVLALPLIWFGAYMQEAAAPQQATRFWKTVAWLFAALFAPTAEKIGIQLSVVLMVAVMLIVVREVGRLKAAPTYGPYAERAA